MSRVMQNGWSDQDFYAFCRKRGWRCTIQRTEVFRCLMQAHNHPAAEEVWGKVREKLPTVSMESIYRILNDFVGAGLVRKLDAGGKSRFDQELKPHNHFFCDRCGALFDLAGTAPTPRPGPALERIGRARKCELRYTGICRKCMKQETTAD